MVKIEQLPYYLPGGARKLGWKKAHRVKFEDTMDGKSFSQTQLMHYSHGHLVTRDAKPRTKYPPAYFRGLHNKVKVLTLMTLYDVWLGDRGAYLTVKQICDLAPVKAHTLLSSLPRWAAWHLVGCRRRGPFIRWRIRRAGRNYLERYQTVIPMNEYIAEIEAHQGIADIATLS